MSSASIYTRAFLFLFQAEDGIRDWSVTGVQTCALPISEEHTSELQSLTNLVCRLLLGVQTSALSRSEVHTSGLQSLTNIVFRLLLRINTCSLTRPLLT